MQMDLVEVMTHIRTKTIRNLYAFAGEETGIMKMYISQIAKVLNKPVEYLDTVQSVIERVTRPGLVSNSKLFVVYDDKSFLKAENLWSRLAKGIKRDTVILVYTKLDKRSKFFKSKENPIPFVPFNPMPPQHLANYIVKAVPMNTSNATRLAEVCECSYSRCMLECDKINSYLGYRQSIADPITPDLAFKLLLNSGAIYQPVGDITFQVVEAIMHRNNVALIERLMSQVRLIKEPRLRLILLLYNNFRALLSYQALPDKSTAESAAGLSKREIFMAQKHEHTYTISESLRALELLQSIEFGVKSGTISEEISLDYFIAQVV